MNQSDSEKREASSFDEIFREELSQICPKILEGLTQSGSTPATAIEAVDRSDIDLAALCLSGGGIRSGIFALGVCPSNRSAKLLAANLSRISRHGEDLP